MNEKVRIVTFAAYYDPMMAYIVLARLKANRINCFMADDNSLQLRPYFNQMMWGMKIKIFENDAEKCRAILAEETHLQEDDDPEIEVIDEVVCPYCGSANARYGGAVEFKFHLPSLLLSLFFMVPLYFRSTWHCFNCHRDGE